MYSIMSPKPLLSPISISLLSRSYPCLSPSLYRFSAARFTDAKRNAPGAVHLSETPKVSFGNRDVNPEEKTRMVGEVFTSVAEKYDIMNDLMSAGIHRLWKRTLVNEIGDVPVNYDSLKGPPSFHVLDVGGGTGDIAFRFLQNVKAKHSAAALPKVTVSDINGDMIAVGRRRAERLNYTERDIQWLVADGSNLPLEDSSVDVITIAFAIRNFTNIRAGLGEFHRVLKPGGRLLCLEFSRVENRLLSALYDGFSHLVIPNLGQLITGDRKSYQYLIESIRKFPPQEEFANLMFDAGFKHVSYNNLTFGVATIHSGFKFEKRK